jgi:hypothetical protein
MEWVVVFNKLGNSFKAKVVAVKPPNTLVTAWLILLLPLFKIEHSNGVCESSSAFFPGAMNP